MLLPYLTPEERKNYKQGDYISCDKEHSRYDDQEELKARYEREQEEPEYCRYVLKASCAYCGDTFYTMNIRQKYCSWRCANDAYMKRRRLRKHAECEKVCPVCGKPFIGKTKATVYCSAACKQKQYRQNKEALLKSVGINLPEQKTVTV